MLVILDLGSTENTAVARAVRALGVYSEIYPHDITREELLALPGVKGVILNGGPNRRVDGRNVEVRPELYDCGLQCWPWPAPTPPAPSGRAGRRGRKRCRRRCAPSFSKPAALRPIGT